MARVDVIIAVHNPQRPVARAARSIVVGNPEARAVVVCHNTGVESVRATMPPEIAAEVKFLQLQDGVPSPAGPFNYGIQHSQAEFVSIMGSDDQLDPGAVANWLREADRWNADAVLARIMRGEQRTLVRSPMLRPLHHGPLDFVRDRLPYRTAPLGLVRLATVAALRLKLTEGLRSGEDLDFVCRLWAGGRCVAASGPGYVEMADAGDRVTHAVRPVAEELAAVGLLLRSDWFATQSAPIRRALAVKLLRRNIADSITRRPQPADWQGSDLADLAELAAAITASAVGVTDLFSARERRLFRALQAAESPQLPELITLAAAAKNYRHPSAFVGPELASWLHPAGSLRYGLAAALLR